MIVLQPQGGCRLPTESPRSFMRSGMLTAFTVFCLIPVVANAGTTGTVSVKGATSGTITIQPQAAAGTYNFNLPTGAGTSGQPLLSGGGSGTAMTFGTLGVGAGGTGSTTTFTQGSVVFSGASGVYSQDNSKFFWDDTNYRLGVGTATPSKDLSFGGAAARQIWVERAASGAGNNLTIASGGAQSSTTDTAGGNLILSSGISTGTNTSNIQFQSYPAAGSTSSSDNAALTALTLSATGATGTTAATTLQANAGSGTNKNGGTLTLSSGISTGTGSSGLNFNVYGAGSTGSTANAATTAVTILGNGNVGIGNTSPAYPLDIVTTSTTLGISVIDSGIGSIAVYGHNTDTDAAASDTGVYGESDSPSGNASGVEGYLSDPSAAGNGVYGHTDSSLYNSSGVTGGAAAGIGVSGVSNTGFSGYFQSSNAANTSATLLIQRAGASTADLEEFMDDSGNVMVEVSSAGHVGIGSTSPNTNLDLGTGFVEWGGESRVSSDFSKTSSTSLSAITGLSSALVAGKTYAFDIMLYLTDAAAGGVKVDLNGGGATVTSLIGEAYLMDATTVKTSTRTSALNSALCSSTTTSTTDITCHITGTITVNAGGTFIPEFAQNTSNGTASTVKTGSIMILHQIN
jgi:hypothetical protein